MASKLCKSTSIVFYQIFLGLLIVWPAMTTVMTKDRCNSCNEDGYACYSGTEFKFCTNGEVGEDIYKCPSGTVCTYSVGSICQATGPNTVQACQECNNKCNPDVGCLAACPTSEPPIDPGSNPKGFCKQVKENSRFPVGNDAETTCRQYVYCFVNNGVWSGQLYNCPAKLYFNRSTRLCEIELPEICGSE